MTIHLNGESREISDHQSIHALIEVLAVPANGTAVAVNDRVVPRSNWGSHLLQDQDRVLVIRAAQGG